MEVGIEWMRLGFNVVVLLDVNVRKGLHGIGILIWVWIATCVVSCKKLCFFYLVMELVLEVRKKTLLPPFPPRKRRLQVRYDCEKRKKKKKKKVSCLRKRLGN